MNTDGVMTGHINTCDGSEYEDLDSYGSENDYCANNYWAGAKLSCQDKGMELPTRAQLAQLASNLYVTRNGNEVTIGATEDKDNLKLKDEYKDNHPLTLGYGYWTSEEDSASYAYNRAFITTYTCGSGWNDLSKNNGYHRVICVSN